MFAKKSTKIMKSSLLIWHLLSKCQIDGEDFVIFCGLLSKHELYGKWRKPDIIETMAMFKCFNNVGGNMFFLYFTTIFGYLHT